MRKIKYSRLVIVGIFIYILFQIGAMLIGKSTPTLVLEKEELEEKINTKGLFVREEYLVKSDASGKVDIKVEDGEKIKNNQVVASIYKDSNSVKSNSEEIEVLNREIEELKKQDKNNNLTATIQLKTKEEQKKILEKQNQKNTVNVNSQVSGIVSYKYDGNEEFYNLEMLNNLGKEDIENAENSYKRFDESENKIKEGQPIARIINGYSCYVGVCVNDKQAKYLEEGQSIKIKLEEEILDAKVDRMYKNNKENTIILKISNQNPQIYDTRVKEFDIIYKQIEGLKVPKTSIQTVDDKEGVYVINQQTNKPEFVELKGIEYENNDFVFVDYYKNEINGVKTIKLYDEIILKPNNINKNLKLK